MNIFDKHRSSNVIDIEYARLYPAYCKLKGSLARKELELASLEETKMSLESDILDHEIALMEVECLMKDIILQRSIPNL